ncbi:exo-alpha-sialidase [Parapedobacter pyrenivorans]|nr:sialidase family protein [Parapedobacter pyrenivorans]
MKRMYKIRIVFLLACLVAVSSCVKTYFPIEEAEETEPPYSGPPRIKELVVSHVDENTTNLRLEVEGDDVELGSFVLRMYDFTSAEHIDDFFMHTNNYWYLNGSTLPSKSYNLTDNGIRDLDTTVNVFSYSFDISDWPDTSVYHFSAGWHTRPQTISYKSMSRQFTLVGGKLDTAKSANIDAAEHRVVYSNDTVYAAFPNLFKMNSGLLGLSFSTKAVRDHIDNTGGSMALVSSDGGYGWSTPTSPMYDISWLTQASDSLLLASAEGYIYVDESLRDSLIAEQRVVRDVRPGTIAYLGGARVSRRSATATAWQQHDPIPIPIELSGLMNHTSAASYITTVAGTKLRAVYGRRKVNLNNEGKSEIYFLRSDDDGQTWDCFPMLTAGISGLEITGVDETALVQAGNGNIIAIMRSRPTGNLWSSTSTDDGLTWSTPNKTDMRGFPADAIKLNDGRLLCVYGYREYPMGIRAAVSDDNGTTWDVDNEMIIRKDGQAAPADLGYPMVTELPNGKIFCVYYHTTDYVTTHIASTHFNIPD